MIDETLLKVLEKIGFNEKEARVYLALLELGQGTATEIAQRAGLKRAIVYHVVERLKKTGYVSDLPAGKVKRFSASDPSKVLQNVRIAMDDLKFMLPIMRALQDKGRIKPRIEFFEGKEAIISVYRMYEKGKDVRYLTSLKRLYEFIPEEIEAWVARYKSGVTKAIAKHFVTDTTQDQEWAKKVRPLGQQVRFLPKGMEMEMDFAIVDDMLGITSFDPLFIVVIYSEKITRSAAKLFDLAWEMGRE